MVAGSQPGTRQRWNSNWLHGFGKAVAQLREERERGRDQGGRLGFANLPATRWFCSGAEEEEVVVAGRGAGRGDRRARSSGRPDPLVGVGRSVTQFCCEL